MARVQNKEQMDVLGTETAVDLEKEAKNEGWTTPMDFLVGYLITFSKKGQQNML
jgi:hypothetical protein